MANTVAFMYPPFLTCFIKVYKQLPCLWRVKFRDFGNKSKREEAWLALLDFTRKSIPDVDVEFVKKRVEILRASFRKEFNRVRESIKSGSGPVHVPKLWYYDLMSFVGNQQNVPPSKGAETADDQRQDKDEEDDKDTSLVEESCSETRQDPDNEDSTATVAESTPPLSLPAERTRQQQQQQQRCEKNIVISGPSRKKRKQTSSSPQQQQQEYHIVVSRPTARDDEYDAMGKVVAAKLRRMTDTQRIHADKLINDVLYKGLLNELSASTSIVGGS